MQNKDHSSRRTLVSFGVGGDARDNFCAKTLEVAVVLVIANIVTPAEAYYLKSSSPHCALAGELDAPTAAPLRKRLSRMAVFRPAQGVTARFVQLLWTSKAS